MKQRNKNHDRIHLDWIYDSVTPGVASRFFVESLDELSDYIDGLTTDGQRAQISSMHISFRSYSQYTFAVLPIYVQTAGTLTDTVDQTVQNVDEIINTACSDVFGVQLAKPFWLQARNVPGDDPSNTAANTFGVELEFDIPKFLIDILNKENETERLQNLHFACLGYSDNTVGISFHVAITTRYSLKTKNVVLR
jgi:hypothetical protein